MYLIKLHCINGKLMHSEKEVEQSTPEDDLCIEVFEPYMCDATNDITLPACMESLNDDACRTPVETLIEIKKIIFNQNGKVWILPILRQDKEILIEKYEEYDDDEDIGKVVTNNNIKKYMIAKYKQYMDQIERNIKIK